MTLPDERLRALKAVNNYLMDVIKMKTVRERKKLVFSILRHYPPNYLIDLCWTDLDKRSKRRFKKGE